MLSASHSLPLLLCVQVHIVCSHDKDDDTATRAGTNSDISNDDGYLIFFLASIAIITIIIPLSLVLLVTLLAKLCGWEQQHDDGDNNDEGKGQRFDAVETTTLVVKDKEAATDNQNLADPKDGLDYYLYLIALLIVWMPIWFCLCSFIFLVPLFNFLASLGVDFVFHPKRAGIITLGILLTLGFSLAQVSKKYPLAYLRCLFYVIFFYLDVMGPVALMLVSMMSGIGTGKCFGLVALGCFCLGLVHVFFHSHDYTHSQAFSHLQFMSESDTRTRGERQSDERQFEALLERGIAQNDWKFMYLPKAHIQTFGTAAILLGLIAGAVVLTS